MPEKATCAQLEGLGRTNRHSATKRSQIVLLIFNRLFLKIQKNISITLEPLLPQNFEIMLPLTS